MGEGCATPPPRREQGDVYALNGDELLALDLAGLLARHREAGAAATITVTRPPSSFGVVELDEGDLVTGFDEEPVSVLGQLRRVRARCRGPGGPARARRSRDEHVSQLAEDGTARRVRYDGTWITVNTPKDLRRAEEHVAANPHWLAA